ncbi:lipase 3-like [Bombyx mandarina]|uniref:Lipase n=1 Tax=Bombyx mandarina TaxID=7092 RepID=A0A6J2JW40_BOMMA|nr:lipase 3-like [Bombyx mandarina]
MTRRFSYVESDKDAKAPSSRIRAEPIFVATARRSPHADYVEELYRLDAQGARYSTNITEDALLDIVGLIKKYKYPVEVHKVVTEDGYILEMQRIPHGRDQNNRPDPKKPAVLVMHGLFASAADWVLMGPGLGLAYVLAEAGYDVWLGNARGTYYSRAHIKLDPDNDSEFWKFSWEEIGSRDLPAMIDYTLQVAGKKRLHYIGHSQGTTVFWAMGSLRPEYNSKIIAMQAYAPVAYLEHNANRLLNIIAPYANSIEALASLIGKNELFGRSDFFTNLGMRFCADGTFFQAMCTNMLFVFAGRSEDMHNATMLPVKLGHTPAGIAVRQIAHYGQLINNNFFRRYDHGRLTNWSVYRSFTPPRYDLSLITAPVFLHYVDDDVFADVRDVRKLHAQLGRSVGMFRVPHATFSHLDFMWGTGAKDLLYDRTVQLMRSLGDE